MHAGFDRGFDQDQMQRDFRGISHAAAIATARPGSSRRTPPATMMSIFSRSNRVSVRLTVSIVSLR
jgi:hypothetical protein